MKITVSKEFKDLIFPLNDEELHALEASVLQHGIKMPLVVWKNNGHNYLLDGFHRWKLIKKHSIKDYQVVTMHFPNRKQAKRFVFNFQLGRRNCSAEGISYLRGSVYNHEKLSAHRPTKNGDKMSALRTSERLSKEYKVTARTIIRDGQFADAVDNIADKFSATDQEAQTKTLLLSRQLDITKKDILELSTLPKKQIKDVIFGKKKFWEARATANKIKKTKELKKAGYIKLGRDLKLYKGDCVDLSKKHLKSNSIDCIITYCSVSASSGTARDG